MHKAKPRKYQYNGFNDTAINLHRILVLKEYDLDIGNAEH